MLDLKWKLGYVLHEKVTNTISPCAFTTTVQVQWMATKSREEEQWAE